MADSVVNSFFPSQVASDQEKMSYEYGLKVGRAIEQEWFSSNSGTARYKSNLNTFHNLRLYARGEQSIQKYKDRGYDKLVKWFEASQSEFQYSFSSKSDEDIKSQNLRLGKSIGGGTLHFGLQYIDYLEVIKKNHDYQILLFS